MLLHVPPLAGERYSIFYMNIFGWPLAGGCRRLINFCVMKMFNVCELTCASLE